MEIILNKISVLFMVWMTTSALPCCNLIAKMSN